MQQIGFTKVRPHCGCLGNRSSYPVLHDGKAWKTWCTTALAGIVAILISAGISYGQISPNIFDTPEGQFLSLFELINEYRESKGVNRLILDTAIVNACRHHSIYMSFYDIADHHETRRDSIHLQENIWDPWDRAKHFEVILGNHSAENALNLHSWTTNKEAYQESSEKWSASVKNGNPDYKYAAAYILDSWKYSKWHNGTLLIDDGVSCGVYVRAYENKRGDIRLTSTFFINSYYPGAR